MTIGVVGADDQLLVRTGLTMILNAQPGIEVVGEAADGHEAVAVARELRPDVCLFDIRMPGIDGVEATRQLAGPGVEDPLAIVVITTFDLDEYVYDALRAGASGFLLKHASPGELAAAVRVVAAGDALLAPSITRRLVEDFAKAGADVLRLLARGQSNREIAAALVLAEQTVKSHVSRILTKLDLRDRAQAVVYAYEAGVVAPGPKR